MTKKRLKLTKTAIASMALVALFAGCSTENTGGDNQNNTTGPLYPYPFETAIIEYQLEGNVEGGITVSLDGDRSAHETNATAEGEEIHNTLLDLGDTLYQIDHNTGTGQKAPNPIYTQLQNIDADKRKEFLTRLAVGAPETGAIPEPKEQREIAGKTCDVYDLKGIGEICLWDGVPLYSSVVIPEQGINNTNTAVSIQVNPEIPESTFEIPSDIEITEV